MTTPENPYCECDDSKCKASLPISWDEYDRLGGGGDNYIVVPDHVETDYHTFEVVEDHSKDGYMVVKEVG